MAGFTAVLLLFSDDWRRTLPLLAGVLVLWVVGTVDDRRNVTPAGCASSIEVGLAAGLWALGLGWDLGGSAGPRPGAHGLLARRGRQRLQPLRQHGRRGEPRWRRHRGRRSRRSAWSAATRWLAVAAAALCGACVGFLPHNLLASPARIFLGDGGSMPIGFAVGALVMIGAAEAAPEWQSLALGVLLVGIPALDTTLVVVSRRRRGIPILTGGRDHMTHRTLASGCARRVRSRSCSAARRRVVSALALLAHRRAARPRSLLARGDATSSLPCVAIAVFDTRLSAGAPAAADGRRRRAAPALAWQPARAPLLLVAARRGARREPALLRLLRARLLGAGRPRPDRPAAAVGRRAPGAPGGAAAARARRAGGPGVCAPRVAAVGGLGRAGGGRGQPLRCARGALGLLLLLVARPAHARCGCSRRSRRRLSRLR